MRRDPEDLPWPLMANPTLQNHWVSFQDHRFLQTNGSHVSPSYSNFHQNPTLQNNDLHQNPILQNNDLFQNPSSQRYPITQILPQAFQQSQNALADSFRRMNLNVSNNQSPFMGSNLHLQRMRIQSAVRGQMGLDPESFGDHLNSMGSLGRAMTQSADFSGTPIGNDFDVFTLRRESQSFDELAYAFPRTRIDNPDLQWAVNGSSAPLLSSMNSHPVVYPRQRSKYSSLEELKGRVSSVAKDQHGCRFLKKKFDNEIKREEIEMIFSELKDQLHELMVHQFADCLIQKLFEAGNQKQRTELLLLLVSSQQSLIYVCTDMHGTRTVQILIERISTQEQRSILLSGLKPIAVTLTTHFHGHHIIEQCFNKFSNEDTKQLMDEIVEHCFDIAIDKSGCCVLQQCLAHAKAEAREHLLKKITENAFDLSADPYGNYVVQYVLGMRLPDLTSNIIVQLERRYVTLSMSKYGSNVVEKCLKDAGQEHRAMIIAEIMHDSDFLKVLLDAYGNFVVQTALDVSEGALHDTLVRFIHRQYHFLHSHPNGKRVLVRIKWCKNRV